VSKIDDLVAKAAALTAKGKHAGAVDALRAAVALDPAELYLALDLREDALACVDAIARALEAEAPPREGYRETNLAAELAPFRARLAAGEAGALEGVRAIVRRRG
jgi:hypothetical protein